MEVDALQRKGPKGKGKKGKEHKGKGGQQPHVPYGGKGKAKEGKQKGKNKGKEHKGKGGQQPQNPGAKGSRANVVCHNCQRKGHYASECWRPRVQQVQAQGSETASTVGAPSTVGPSASQVAGSTATTAKRVARVEIDMTSSAFQDDAESSGHVCVLTKVCPEDPAAQPSFASLCKSLASACIDPLKPHVLVPVPETEVFDMSYSDSDCVWTVPDEMHGATCVGWLSSARDSEYVKCKAPARNRARPSRRSRPPLQCEPMLHPCETAAEHLVTPPVHPLQDLSVCAVSWADMSNEIEVVVDSGSDASCLPLSWAHVGRADGASLDNFRDAQGRMIRGSQMRTAVLQIDGVQFKERWLLSSVTQPLFSVGKLLRRGWDIIHHDGVPYLTNPGGTVRVPMHYRHNSLHARGSIMSVVMCANDCLSDDREDDAARHHEPQEAELDDEQVHGNDQQVEVPQSAEADGPDAAAVRALKLGSAWLNLGSQYTEMQPGIFARQDQSDRFLDVSYDGAEWKLIEINCLISLFDDLEKEFEPKGSRHIITIGSVHPLQVEKLFDHQPVAWNDDSYDGEYADAPPDENMIEEDEKAEDVDDGSGVGPVSPAEVLGIGKSGGKHTVFARIEQHLKTQELLQQHAFQTDGVPLPLEQKFVEEPTAEQKRRHELSHVPYADWCPHCVKFRAKADKHVSSKPELRDDSVCSFDFAYTGRSSPAEFEGASKDKLVCLVIKDSHTGAMHAVPTPAKGGPIAFKYLVAEVCRFLNYCGHESVTIRSDGEPACLALQQGIKAFRTKMGLRTHLEQTEPGDHQSNASEQAIDSIRQLAGCILDQFEERAQTTVGAMHPMHGYAWRHAAWLHMRMSRHNDLSAFQVINGRPYAGSVRRLPTQYDSSLFAKLRDMPWSQASFLAGQVGQARKQKTLQGDEDAGTEPQVEQQAEVPSQAGAAENPLPFPGHLLPDDAMLQEFVPPLPREPVLHSPEPPTPVAATPGQQAETPMQVETASPLVSFDDGPGIASSSSGIARPATEEAGGEAPARKKLRLDAVQTSAYDCEMFHHDEAPELLDESAEQFLDCQDESIWDTEDWADDSANAPDIPSILIKPFSETEPVCDASELEAIDAAADSFELERLTKAGVLEQSESWLEGHRTLSSKYVRTWRLKVINQERVWLRRARLVAREFAHLDPGRQHLFAPTTTQCMLRIVPSLFIRNFGDGWSLLSLDMSDAFLQCKQQHDTLTKVDGKWYKLFRMLPGQRDGSATWFQDFMCEIRAAVAAEPLAEQPVLFRIPHAEGNHMCQGGGMVHVDDMLAAGLTARLQELENHLKSKFKVSSEWIRQVGDEVSFLKRSLGNRQGVGRTRHIDGKLLWLQQMTQEKMLDISPVGTAENVAGLPTKPLKPDRVEFILARLNVRDKDCGYALVGNAHLLDHRTRHHVSRVVKRGAVNPQLVLQILALALQADSVASADDEPNTHDDDALSQGTGEHGYGEMFWNFLEQLLYAIFLIADFLAEHPMMSFVLSQCVIIAVLCGIFLCRGSRPEKEKANEAAASCNEVRFLRSACRGVEEVRPDFEDLVIYRHFTYKENDMTLTLTNYKEVPEAEVVASSVLGPEESISQVMMRQGQGGEPRQPKRQPRKKQAADPVYKGRDTLHPAQTRSRPSGGAGQPSFRVCHELWPGQADGASCELPSEYGKFGEGYPMPKQGRHQAAASPLVGPSAGHGGPGGTVTVPPQPALEPNAWMHSGATLVADLGLALAA
ncbi:unnamed protein product [Symbiodinium sp. CCMP2592]|nr:unnamed protein product [Symbiodinium sp. CCMP2592]